MRDMSEIVNVPPPVLRPTQVKVRALSEHFRGFFISPIFQFFITSVLFFV